jgi:hypothetical protein
MFYAPVNPTQSTETATGYVGLKEDDSSKKTQLSWYHEIDRKHTFLQMKFEAGLSNSFSRKSMSKKKWHFSWGMVHPFFKGGVGNISTGRSVTISSI